MGQNDKMGRAYILHPLRVLARLDHRLDQVSECPFGAEEDYIRAQTVAVLHDVVEDTEITLDQLRKEFEEPVVDAVDAITRRQNERYKTYLHRVRENRIARVVKIMDIEDNISLTRNGPYHPMLDDDGSARQIQKYRRALNYLNEFTEEF